MQPTTRLVKAPRSHPEALMPGTISKHFGGSDGHLPLGAWADTCRLATGASQSVGNWTQPNPYLFDLVDVGREFLSLVPCVSAYDALTTATTATEVRQRHDTVLPNVSCFSSLPQPPTLEKCTLAHVNHKEVTTSA